MAESSKSISFDITTRQRPDFDQPLIAYVFDRGNALLERAEIKEGKLRLDLPGDRIETSRMLIAPLDPERTPQTPTPEALLRLGAYEPVIFREGAPIDRIEIPGSIIDIWPICLCWVRGRVVRNVDNRAVCEAHVHVCEVDRIPLLIAKLPDPDIFRLRDDLFEVFARRPPIPIPDPDPFRPTVTPGRRFTTDLPVDARPALRFRDTGGSVAAARAPRVDLAALNPQPLPPLPASEILFALRSRSPVVLRRALVDNWQLLVPWFCLWRHWWWWFRCDEVAVVTTDSWGRFETMVLYPCNGDHPDLYFWVEYDFGAGFEIVYHPPIACNTWWNYACGSEVVLRVTDPRVPGCEEEPDLPGLQVVVASIGAGVAVRQIRTTGVEGVVDADGAPFGAALEPRVDFSRSALISAGIPYYRWSFRRLSGPDGVSATVAADTVPIGTWTAMTRDVYRHYKSGTTFPSDFMGPMPTIGPNAAPDANLFRIRPLLPPAGNEWVVLNESIDLASAYFETASLSGAPVAPATDDLAAGLYELKLELFDTAGNVVDWTAAGIDLRITDQDAPFGTGTVTTHSVGTYNRILDGAATKGFRMVLRVDNGRCSADILPVGGDVSPDPDCGFHNYGQPTDVTTLFFVARHPNGFANYDFRVSRGADPTSLVSTSGRTGDGGAFPFANVGGFTYSSGSAVSVAMLLGTCSNAALAEGLSVGAMATNGYGRLSGYDASDKAAFALAQPCACEPPTP